MANKIILKRASTAGRVPLTTDLDLGELAINTHDGRLFAKKNDGSATIIDLKQNDPIRILGDASSNYAWDQSTYTSNVTLTLNTVNGNVGTYGGKVAGVIYIPIVTVDAKGRVTSVTTDTYSAAGDLGTMASQNANSVAITGGTIDGTAIGGTVRASGNFTDIDASGNVSITGTLFSNDLTASSITVDGDTIITGNLTVQGVTTTVNSNTVSVGDLNIELAKDATTAAQANGGGITVVGPTTPATFSYASTDDSWNINKKLNGTSLSLTGDATADSFAGEIRPNSNGSSAGGIVFPTNPGGGAGDAATIRYYASSGEATVLELKVTDNISGSDADIIRLNASGGTTVDNQLTAGDLASTSLTSGRMVFAGSGGKLVDDSDLTYNSTTNTISVPAISVGTFANIGNLTSGRIVFAGANGRLIDNSDLTYDAGTNTFAVSNLNPANVSIANSLIVDGQTSLNILDVTGQTTLANLTVNGVTSLGSITSANVSSGQIVYGGINGALKTESDLTYNETTNTLSAGNLVLASTANIGTTLDVSGVTTLKSTVSLTDGATFTVGNYSTGAFRIAGDASFAKNIQVQTDIRAAGTIYKAGFEVLNTQDTIDGGSY